MDDILEVKKYNIEGMNYFEAGDYDKALEYFEKVLLIRETVLGKDHPDTATTYNNLGGVYNEKGEYEKALGIFGKKLGKNHPNSTAIRNNLEFLRKQVK